MRLWIWKYFVTSEGHKTFQVTPDSKYSKTKSKLFRNLMWSLYFHKLLERTSFVWNPLSPFQPRDTVFYPVIPLAAYSPQPPIISHSQHLWMLFRPSFTWPDFYILPYELFSTWGQSELPETWILIISCYVQSPTMTPHRLQGKIKLLRKVHQALHHVVPAYNFMSIT